MARFKQLLMGDLKVDGIRHVRGAELIVQNRGLWVVNSTQAATPQPREIIRVIIIGRLESLIESPEPLPGRTWRQKECRRAVVHIAAKHVHGSKRVVAAAIAEARSVAPHDTPGFLQAPIEHDQTAAYRSNPRVLANRLQCGAQSARQKLSIIVEEQYKLASRLTCSLVDGKNKMAVFGITDNRCAVDQIQQFPSFIRRCVVDDDDFEALEAMLGNGSQALQSQFCAIEEDSADENHRIRAAM